MPSRLTCPVGLTGLMWLLREDDIVCLSFELSPVCSTPVAEDEATGLVDTETLPSANYGTDENRTDCAVIRNMEA